MIRTMSDPEIEYARDLTDDYHLNFRSISEVQDALSRIVSTLAKDKTILFRGKPKPKRAQTVNALILYIDSLPHRDQREILRKGLDVLNRLLEDHVEDESGTVERPEACDPVRTPGKPNLPKRTSRKDVG